VKTFKPGKLGFFYLIPATKYKRKNQKTYFKSVNLRGRPNRAAKSGQPDSIEYVGKNKLQQDKFNYKKRIGGLYIV
jgi:hypothetical protein